MYKEFIYFLLLDFISTAVGMCLNYVPNKYLRVRKMPFRLFAVDSYIVNLSKTFLFNLLYNVISLRKETELNIIEYL